MDLNIIRAMNIHCYDPFQPILSESGLVRFGLTMQEHAACPELKNIVHSYLQISAKEPVSYAIIPDGTQAVFISRHATILGGAHLKASDIQIPEAGDYFGIRLYPAALKNFFNLDISEISDPFIDGKLFPSEDFGTLHENIFMCSSFEKRVSVCENWLLKNKIIHKDSCFDNALELIYKSLGNIKIDELSKNIGWSSRHLNRMFKRHTGLSTKSFTQIIRLQFACKNIFESENNLIEDAINFGYFDQAHLLNNFKKFLQESPNYYLSQFRSDFYNT